MGFNKKLGSLRNKMAEYRLDGYIVNNSDPHFSEYLPDRYRQISWLTGFTGSNAQVLVTNNDAFLWTDGRYFIQAENELKGTEFKMMKMATKGYPTLLECIEKVLPEGRKLGIDANITSQKGYESIEEVCNKSGIDIVDKYDLISEIWEDRPENESNLAYIHEEKFAGLSPKEKLENLRTAMEKENIDVVVISALEDVAWLYNLRGSDIKNNPVVISYALVSKDEAKLFIDINKLSFETLEHLEKNNIDYLSYEEVFASVNNLKNKKIYLDKTKTARSIYSLIDNSNEVFDGMNITTKLKAIKNPIEIKNQKNAYIKDGVALTKFIYWLKENKNVSDETEYSVGEKLESFRKEQEYYIMPSFDTIAGYKENGAMMHYKAEENSKTLENESFLLVDSGGQYYDGTTDITRTIALGKLTKEEKRDFTLVLKGHLDLLGTVFLENTTGHALDVIARRPIWLNRMDYKSGTGHGVGYFLSVHEGPQNISRKAVGEELEPGMIVTIEPGIYKEGKYGIRIENVALVVEDEDTPDGKFYRFQAISFAPIDLDAIIPEMLDEAEKRLLNEYHKEVYNKLKKYFTGEELKWLEKATQAID